MSNDFAHSLKDKGLKVTPARMLILGAFSTDCGPLNAEMIFNKLMSKEINRVTIYRTLVSLSGKGILNRVDLQKDSLYYELKSDHHHHHVVCTDCGVVESFDGCGVEKISKSILGQSSKFKIINQHSLEMFGVCKSCAKI